VQTFCEQGGEGDSSDVDVRNFDAKIIGFRNLWCVCTDKGVELARTFYGPGRKGSIFRDFVRTSFMDGPLKVSYQYRYH